MMIGAPQSQPAPMAPPRHHLPQRNVMNPFDLSSGPPAASHPHPQQPIVAHQRCPPSSQSSHYKRVTDRKRLLSNGHTSSKTGSCPTSPPSSFSALPSNSNCSSNCHNRSSFYRQCCLHKPSKLHPSLAYQKEKICQPWPAALHPMLGRRPSRPALDKAPVCPRRNDRRPLLSRPHHLQSPLHRIFLLVCSIRSRSRSNRCSASNRSRCNKRRTLINSITRIRTNHGRISHKRIKRTPCNNKEASRIWKLRPVRCSSADGSASGSV
jgi:hypothetical protein